MATVRLAVGVLIATAAAAVAVTTTTAAAFSRPPSAATFRTGVLRQAEEPSETLASDDPPPGVFDVWDRDLLASCVFGPNIGCAPAHRCVLFSECVGRCFTDSKCVVETPVGGACAPRVAQACADNAVCVGGVCTAVADLPAEGIGLGDDCGTWVRSQEVRQALSCADGLSCLSTYSSDERSPRGIRTEGYNPRVCHRVAGLNEGCDSYASVVCGDNLFCEQANTRSAAGVVPSVGADLGGVCRPVADRSQTRICVQTGTFSLCEHNEVCSTESGGPRQCTQTAREGEYCGRGWLCDTREPGRLVCVSSWDEGAEATPTLSHGVCRPLESRPVSAGGGGPLPPTPTPAGPTPGPGTPCADNSDCATLNPFGPGRLFCLNATASADGGAPTGRQCVTSAELGEPCGEPAGPGAPLVPCREGRCHTVLLGEVGGPRSAPKCVTWRSPGRSCDGVGRVCWDGYTCASTEGMGEEGDGGEQRCVRWAAQGEPCGIEGVAGCNEGLTCEEQAEGDGRVCVAAGGEGDYYVPYKAST
ncbi:hypothetical protein MMPV_003831 [Pyropia vietnamensis]